MMKICWSVERRKGWEPEKFKMVAVALLVVTLLPGDGGFYGDSDVEKVKIRRRFLSVRRKSSVTTMLRGTQSFAGSLLWRKSRLPNP